MLNTFEETFEVTEMRTFKHEPFFIVGGRGGGAYSWYFTVFVSRGESYKRRSKLKAFKYVT